MRANQSLEVALLNQETGIRGYALTRNAEFLVPYRDGLADEAAALAVLAHLPRWPAGACAQLDEVERAAQGWRSGYAEPVIATGDGSVAPDPAIGKTLFDATGFRWPTSPQSSTRSGWRPGTGSTAPRTRCGGSGSPSPW